MDHKRTDPNSPSKELRTLLKKESTHEIEISNRGLCNFDAHATEDKNGTSEVLPSVDPIDVSYSKCDVEIGLWKNKKLCINKCLIPLRIAQFLWFGAGRIPSHIIFVLMKQRGVTLVELSSVFSFVFLVQTTSCFVCGVVADKIGNAKPVLIFLILATASVVVGFVLAPDINESSCLVEGTGSNYSPSSFGQNSTSDIAYFHNNTKPRPLEEETVDTNVSITITILPELAFENFSDFSAINVTDSSDNENCSKPCLRKPGNDCHRPRTLKVAIYYALVLCLFAVWSTAYRFMDFTSISLANRCGSCYGKERFVAIAGEFLIQVLAAFVFAVNSSTGERYNYESPLCVSAAVMLLAAISVLSIRAPILPPGRNLTRKALKLITDTDILAFFIVVFIAGNGFCFNMNFRLWFLQTLGASKILISLHLVTSSLYSLPVLLTASWWLRKFGTTKLLVLALLSYAVNQVSYSFLYVPWLSLMIELTDVFTYQIFWIALVEHGQMIAPVGFGATVNAMAGAFHFGLGRSSGVPIGGLLTNYFGIRTAYRILAGAFLLAAILYSIFLYKKHSISTKERKRNGKQIEVTKEIRKRNGGLPEAYDA